MKISKKTTEKLEADYKKIAQNDLFEKSNIPDSYGFGVRHVQILLGFLSLAIGYISRAHMGVTVVAMTNTLHGESFNVTIDIHKNVTNDILETTTTWEGIDYENMTISVIDSEIVNVTAESGIYRKYDWPKSIQELVLGSFFLGYTIMMVPMGVVCQKFGGKLPMQIALFMSGVLCIITPWIASWGGWKAVCACRIIQGLSQAGYYPGLQTFVARWSPASELGKFYCWAFTGTTFGTVLAFQLAGLLASLGWPYIYWVIGSLCLIMFVIMTVFGAATPSDHKFISDLEKKFIMGNAKVEKKQKVPLKAVLSSKHVWATWSAHVGSTMAFVFMFSQVPTYIHYILNVDVQKSGLLSSLPYIASFVASLFLGPLSDYVTNRNILSLTNARRVSNSIGQLGMAVCLVAVCYTKNVKLAVFCLVMAMVFQAALSTGWMVNYIDLSPNFSGSLMSFGNTLSYSTNTLLPLPVAYIVTDVTNQLQWRTIFLAMAALATISNISFVAFMSADRQPWNDYGYERTATEEQKKDEKC